MKGLEGHVDFKIDVPHRGGEDESELISLWWERPYIGSFKKNIRHDVHLRNSRDGYLPHVRVIDHEMRGWSEGSFGDVFAHVVLPFPLSPVATMPNQAHNTHCFWTIEIVNNEGRISLPLEIPPPVIYGVQEGGVLLWYQHEGYSDGAATWATNSGVKIGHGWDFRHVFSGGSGIVYAIENKSLDPRTGQRSGGDLLWYRHDGWQNGSQNWTGPHRVGKGWGDFRQAFYAGEGVIYAIRDNGDILWYKHEGHSDGAFTWAQDSGKQVGHGWDFKHVFSGGGGIVYAIENKSLDPRTGQRSGGDLLWYRQDRWQDGSGDWAGPSIAGTGWGDFNQVFHGGGEIIYAIQETSRNPETGQHTGGQLLWYRHQGRDNGANNWAQGSGRVVGLLWNFAQVFSG
ncbi:MAG: tachylectin-related carbohydrate-binding protein [Candidatus Scalindua sp.]|nr:tachylectin-related carbohydrate-binding protein [Candidatus Scalindua sp.]